MLGRVKSGGITETDQLWAKINNQVAPLYEYWVDVFYSSDASASPNSHMSQFLRNPSETAVELVPVQPRSVVTRAANPRRVGRSGQACGDV